MAIIGIDIGGTKILVASCNEQGAICYRRRISTPQNPTEAVKSMKMLVQAAAAAAQSQPMAIGIACGGPLDPVKQCVSPLHLPQWRNLELGRLLQAEFNCPVRLENDADAGAFAEYHVADAKAMPLLYVTLSTGLGGGLLLDGEIFRGQQHSHPEIGHQSVAYADILQTKTQPLLCACGAEDCLEALISGTAIKRHFGRSANELNATEWEKVGTLLGRGLRNVSVMFSPELLVLSGGVALGGAAQLLEPARRELKRNLRIVAAPELKISTLGYDAALWGALALASTSAGTSTGLLQKALAQSGTQSEL